MIHKYNIAELSLVDRPIGGTKQGFGSTLPQHAAQHDRRYFSTENRNFYGQPDAQGQKPSPADLKMAGTNVRPFELQGTKIISNLVGEIYSKQYDPQEQTDVQRSWLPQQDAAIRAVIAGNSRKNQVNFFDNQNSLPLGEGVQLALMQFGEGIYNRRGTDITKVPNQVITRK